MDEVVRSEIEKLHGRINGVQERVTVLEAQTPHINAALQRIQNGVAKLNGHIVKAIWIVFAMFLAMVFKFAMAGGFNAAGI